MIGIDSGTGGTGRIDEVSGFVWGKNSETAAKAVEVEQLLLLTELCIISVFVIWLLGAGFRPVMG